VGDVNGDGRDDVIVRRSQLGRTNLYSLYLQQTNGRLALDPALTYADKAEPFAWLCWADLNRDGKVDLIKSRWLNAPSFVPGIPSGKALVSIYIADAHGKIPSEPRQVFRKNDWLPMLPVVDVDGDGYPDLVLGYFQMDSREGLRKQITARQIDYSLRFFFYRPGAGFPKEADCQRDVAIHLDRAEVPLDWGLPQNFYRYVKLEGDFWGNGKTALLVRDHSDHISVYSFVSRVKGFSAEPDLKFSCPEPIDEWQVTDLNHDGVGDVIVKLANQSGFRVFISQK
jgi:FG-GAP-like repeat